MYKIRENKTLLFFTTLIVPENFKKLFKMEFLNKNKIDTLGQGWKTFFARKPKSFELRNLIH